MRRKLLSKAIGRESGDVEEIAIGVMEGRIVYTNIVKDKMGCMVVNMNPCVLCCDCIVYRVTAYCRRGQRGRESALNEQVR